MQKFTIEENKTMFIVERRGVGVHNFKTTIDKMVVYIKNYIKTNEPISIEPMSINNKDVQVEKYECTIPKHITDEITWVSDVKINIIVANLIGDLKHQDISHLNGGGWFENSPYDCLNDEGKLNTMDIGVTSYAINGNLIYRTVYLVMYHEFNHAYENYNRLKNSRVNLYNNTENLPYNEIMKNQTNSDIDIRYFSYLIYRLFFDTEFNALVSSVYGDLKGMDSSNYRNDITKTKAFQIYNEIKTIALPHLKNIPIENWEKFRELFLKDVKYPIEHFRKYILKTTDFKLNDLFKRMAKTASLWYEEKHGEMSETIRLDGHMAEQAKIDFYNLLNSLN